jgi:regulatory protein YycH of two-component signal transduction system YycFG
MAVGWREMIVRVAEQMIVMVARGWRWEYRGKWELTQREMECEGGGH